VEEGEHLFFQENGKEDEKESRCPFASDTTRTNIPGREVGLPCKCKRKKCCSLLQGRELNGFCNLGDFNIQNAYIFSFIKATRPNRAYPKKDQNLILLGEVARFRITRKQKV
jgi:hypothetical protein